MSKTWKHTERRIAKLLGGERVPITGRARGSTPDVAHPWLSIEVKHRKKLPDWMLEAMDQAKASAKEGMLPISIFHQKNSRDDFVMIQLSDFIEWFGS